VPASFDSFWVTRSVSLVLRGVSASSVRIKHSAITSPVFELIRTVELDLTLDDETWPTRIEIFRDTERSDFFRCRVWQLELFRIQSTGPQERGHPAHQPSDHLLMVEWNGPHVGLYKDFVAESAEAALSKVMADFGKFLEHTTCESPA
jgi:hypothetical protein